MPMRCAECDAEVSAAHRFCAFCGAPTATPSQRPTMTRSSTSSVGVAPAEAAVAARIASGERAERAGFTPGTILAGRYRIIGLLGRGGMGEVYRADDLKLGQAVALKFLPRALADDATRLDRFLAEVRIARQISHANVCRVYDIGVFDGDHFLSMEYIDGEDLASLLLRIGHLPADKALDISHQICAGLAAAHYHGVLHRDLKPANVMLDGRGRVRITDFGLAVAADAAGLDATAWGTPLYMAPEQLAGQPASVRSDVYALGLVLYELYTGKRAFTAASLAELRARKEQEIPRAPSEFIKDMDPAVERLILRAIARDPAGRPASVAQVAAALPGGTPLATALRAGETPSPEMVAASGAREALEPRVVWGLFALVLFGTVTAAAMGAKGLLWRTASPERSPEALAENARQMLFAFGYAERGVDRASGLEVDLDHLRYLQAQHPTSWRTVEPDPNFLRFWYRESPQPLEAWRFPYQYGNVSRITPSDPPLEIADMTLVRLDPSGRLIQLVVVPAAVASSPVVTEPDWAAFLARAGFDASAWQSTTPERNPPVYGDARAAWIGTWPSARAVPVRLEAAALGGKPVYFEVIFPWTRPPRTPATFLTATERGQALIALFIAGITIIAAAVFAQRNVRAGRGDRRGALRLAGFVFLAMFLSWLFGESHVATLWEVALVVMALSWAMFAAGFCWLAYLAGEPFLRRRWPEVLITWTRLLGGEYRDPLVGRDVLVGCAAGSLLAIVAIGAFIVPAWLNVPSNLVFVDLYGLAYRPQGVLPLLLWRAAQAIVAGLGCVFLLLLMRLALRSQWGAVAVFVIGNALVGAVFQESFWLPFLNSFIHFGVFVLLIVRFGLLAAVVQFYTWGLFVFFPITTDLSAWYAGAGLTAAFVFGVLTLYGFTTALGGQPAFGKATFEE
jgi:serine/threonine-protein kinase